MITHYALARRDRYHNTARVIRTLTNFTLGRAVRQILRAEYVDERGNLQHTLMLLRSSHNRFRKGQVLTRETVIQSEIRL